MNKETLKANNTRIEETLKALNKALAKEDRTKKALDEARGEVKSAKENYTTALEDAKRAVVGSPLPIM